MTFTTTIRAAVLSAALAATLALVMAASPGRAGAASPCDLVAAPGGSDSNPGTLAAPLASAESLVDALAPGQTGCLRAGTFLAPDLGLRMWTPNTTLRSFPGERATVRGRLRVESSATGVTVEGLMLDGRNPRNELSPLIFASEVTLRDNEITNYHTSICVHVDQAYEDPVPENVLIENNRIHHCGEMPAANNDHGIYIGEARGTVIRNNVIYDNADRGVQFYPEAHGSTVVGNVIDGNGQGVNFGGEAEWDPTSHNIVRGNVISNSRLRDNVESSWGGSPGRDNVVRGNCIGGGAYDDGDGGILQGAGLGFEASANVLAEPKFVNRAAGDFRIVPGTACDLGSERSLARVTLKTNRHRVAEGSSMVLRGRSPSTGMVQLKARVNGSWQTLRRVWGQRGQRYRAVIRARRTGRIRFKATAPGAKDSKRVQVRVSKKR
jgi:hypothetical protein